MLKNCISLKINQIKRILTEFCSYCGFVFFFLGGLNEDELKAFDKNLMPYFQPVAVRYISPEIFQVRA